MKPRENEEALLSEFNLAEVLTDRSIDAILAFDKQYKIIAWNKTASIVYGISKKQAMGKSLFELIPGLKEDCETMNAIQHALFGEKTFVPASKLFTHRRHAENHYISLKHGDGTIVGVMNIVHDVAHRIKAEQQLQQLNEELEKRYKQLQITADEMASFTYITSNKIKEPIRHIYTGIEHLIKVEASRLTDSGKAAFRRMQSSLNRMDLLLDDILSLTQISILQKTDAIVDLDKLANDIGELIKRKSEKKVDILIDKLGSITGHENYLHMLFYNLLDNAVKFNKNDEVIIKISCETVFLNDETKEPFSEIQYYKLMISDNGIGFEEKDYEKIFRMFEKLHDKEYKGSGIGLTVVQKIMNAHGGFIQVQSEPEKGSCFHCFFPVSPT
ncbi:MAG TPA: ATP-binding protein [Parafilimonas sp.]|nr:ATP-binding protein [Parafilimonas sp.]